MSNLTDWRALHGQSYEDTPVLVTGGAGFIGSHLVQALLALGARVRVVDDLSGGREANLAPFREQAGDRLQFVAETILNRAVLDELCAGVRVIFHQAALGSVPRSIAEPRIYHEANVEGTLNVLEAARSAKVGRVVFAASSSAYGDSPTLPKIEHMPVQPKSPYAASKVSGEAMLFAWASSYGLDTVSLRYFNIFGPRQNANSAYAAVIAAFAKALLGGERPRIFGDGEQSRDFTFVDNAVHANLLAGCVDKHLGGQVFNVACGHRITVNRVAQLMAEQLERTDLKPVHEAERAGDVRHSHADLTKVREALGYQPLLDFDRGLEATVQWYRSEGLVDVQS